MIGIKEKCTRCFWQLISWRTEVECHGELKWKFLIDVVTENWTGGFWGNVVMEKWTGGSWGNVVMEKWNGGSWQMMSRRTELEVLGGRCHGKLNWKFLVDTVTENWTGSFWQLMSQSSGFQLYHYMWVADHHPILHITMPKNPNCFYLTHSTLHEFSHTAMDHLIILQRPHMVHGPEVVNHCNREMN